MRRMVLHTRETLADYARLVEADRAELQALYQDILINVTSFFRDPEMYEVLKTSIFPEIIKYKSSELSHQDLDRGMLHRSRGLLPGHHTLGIPGRQAGTSSDSVVRH